MLEIDKTQFGTFLAQLRKEIGLVQKELAENYQNCNNLELKSK